MGKVVTFQKVFGKKNNIEKNLSEKNYGKKFKNSQKSKKVRNKIL